MSDIKPINELDFFEVKDSLKEFLRNQDQFKDYDFEGSNMNVLLDVLAYNTFYNQFYNNMAISEMFLDSAQLRNSVISHAKELNYLPRSVKSAALNATIRIVSNQADSSFVIPKNFKINARCGSKTYTFLTDKQYIATRVSGNVFEASVRLNEGRLVTEIVDINDPILSNSDIDTDSIEVFVNDVQYKFMTDIFGVDETAQVFYLEPEENGRYSLQFGDNQFGYQPTQTDVIRAVYRISHGEEANGINSFNAANQNYGGASSMVVIPVGTSAGGADAESIERIRKYAPKALQVQERAVTRTDYEVLLKQRFPEIEAISVYGGDEVVPPLYGRAIISVDVKGLQGAGQSQIDEYREYISDKTPLAIEPVFVPAKFLYVKADVSINYNRRLTAKPVSQLVTEAKATIRNYFDSNNLNDFNSKLRISRLASAVDDSEQAFNNTSVSLIPYVVYEPVLGVVETPYFDFTNELEQPYVFDETKGFENYVPCITSSVFSLSGEDVTMMDDGQGNIYAITAKVTAKSVFRKNIGTVDYATGAVRLSSIVIDSYVGTGIEIYARTVDKNIYSRRDKILSLLDKDISVSVVAE